MSELAAAILRDYRVIAVVGLSRSPGKAAHYVPLQLQQAGFRVVPVNPQVSELLGETAYPSLEEIPFPVELVLVFRPSAQAPAVARSAVAIEAKALWLQQGIASREAERIAKDAGLRYVEDTCAAVVQSVHGIEHLEPIDTGASSAPRS